MTSALCSASSRAGAMIRACTKGAGGREGAEGGRGGGCTVGRGAHARQDRGPCGQPVGPPTPHHTCVAATSAFTRSRHMMENTTVLPVPDLACTMRSDPTRPSGMEACCTGEGRSKPAAASAATVGAGSSRSLNDPASLTTSSVRYRCTLMLPVRGLRTSISTSDLRAGHGCLHYSHCGLVKASCRPQASSCPRTRATGGKRSYRGHDHASRAA